MFRIIQHIIRRFAPALEVEGWRGNVIKQFKLYNFQFAS